MAVSKILQSCVLGPRAAQLIFAASVGSILFALIMQYGFDKQPCILCLWQRVPFVLAAMLMALSLWLKPNAQWTSIVFYACGGLFLINTGLAFFHTGVEQHWWAGTSGCAITPLNAQSIEDLRTAILNTVTAHCDEVNFRILGYSMANWNVPFSFGLAVFSFIAGWLSRDRQSD
jgi:disulfide bond formation protein DsbB